jgi:tetratricopeptide (TPR) repeat protein
MAVITNRASDDQLDLDQFELNRAVGQLYHQGRYQEAVALATHARDSARRHHGQDHLYYADTLNNLAVVYRDMGDHAAALPLFRQALEIYRTRLSENHPDYYVCLENLAVLHRELGDHATAVPLFRQVLETRRTTLGERHPAYAGSLNNLAMLYQDMGDYTAALRLLRQALDVLAGRGRGERVINLTEHMMVRRYTLGADYPEYDLDLGASLNDMANRQRGMADRAVSLPLYGQVRDIRRTAPGENHPDYAISLNNLAGLYRDMGDRAAAIPLFREALDIWRSALGSSFQVLLY